ACPAHQHGSGRAVTCPRGQGAALDPYDYFISILVVETRPSSPCEPVGPLAGQARACPGACTVAPSRFAYSRRGNAATNGVSAPTTPSLPAPPGEPSGSSRPGSG